MEIFVLGGQTADIQILCLAGEADNGPDLTR